jgi:hypothetical protein
LLSGKVTVDILEKINQEIDSAEYTTSDPDTIIQAKEAGLVGEQVASMALGFKPDEYLQAQSDHLARIVRIAQAQSEGAGAGVENPAARGLPDLSDDPANETREEKQESRDTTLKETTKIPVRGKGK